jgi:hypothetical protein
MEPSRARQLRVQLSALRPLSAVRSPRGKGSPLDKVLVIEPITITEIATLQTSSQTVKCSLGLCGHAEGMGPATFPLVRALLVGATGFEPVTSSVSGGSGQFAAPRAAPRFSMLPQLKGGVAWGAVRCSEVRRGMRSGKSLACPWTRL